MTCLFRFNYFLLYVEKFYYASFITKDLWEENQTKVEVKFHYCRASDEDTKSKRGQGQK